MAIIFISVIAIIGILSSTNGKIKNYEEKLDQYEKELDDQPTRYERDVKKYDFEVDYDWDMENSQVTLIFTPNEDIENLELQFTIYDKDYNILIQTNKKIGNLKKGIQITKILSWYEYDFDVPVDYLQWKVVNGTTISYY